ncbi:MAG TPA: helix-turn-helix domain-containing protein [Pyrinomonadaceae bacterium]|jgi:excisionase family DNA binding protein
MHNTIEKLYTKSETAQILRISIATLDRRITDGSIEYFKVGWQILFNHEQIQKYLSSCKNALRGRRTKKNASVLTA